MGLLYHAVFYSNDRRCPCAASINEPGTAGSRRNNSRVSFSGVVRQQDYHGGGETVPVPSQQRTSSRRGPMMGTAAEEYDAAYAATVAAVAYAIAAREEERLLLASQDQRQHPAAASTDEPARTTAPSSKSPRTPRRGESLKRPIFEGSRSSSSSRWFTGKEPVNDDYQDEQADVSVTRPLRPAQTKNPAAAEGEGASAISDERPPASAGPAPRMRTTKDPSFTRKPTEKRGSRRFEFEQDQGNQTTAAPPTSRWSGGKDDYQDEQANVSVNRPLRPAQKKPAAEGGISDEVGGAFPVADYYPDPPRVKKDPSLATRRPPEKRGSRRFEQDRQGNQTTSSSSYNSAAGRDSGSAAAFSSENEAMADAWEKDKLARIKKQYNETMETIGEWESEKKAKARRQKELKDESESERKRAKALEEYNEEMARINKVAAASRLTAEEKRRSAESKARDKAHTIRTTGKLPGTCGCF